MNIWKKTQFYRYIDLFFRECPRKAVFIFFFNLFKISLIIAIVSFHVRIEGVDASQCSLHTLLRPMIASTSEQAAWCNGGWPIVVVGTDEEVVVAGCEK